MNKHILFVDDDERILRSALRTFKNEFEVETASTPQKALEILKSRHHFSVVISDLKMPKMDGVEFLEQAAKLRPDTVRVMLTGFADLEVAVDAVNKGHIFRFLTKPCDNSTLKNALIAAVKQHQLVTSERILLERTLKGSIEVLIETLSLVNSEAYGRAARLRRFARAILTSMKVEKTWKYELATMLSQLGHIVLSENAIRKISSGQPLTGEELQLYEMAPQIGKNLLEKIPRMEDIATILAYQLKNYDGSGVPHDNISGDKIPLGSRILKIVTDFDSAVNKGNSWGEAFLSLEEHSEWYDPLLLYYLECAIGVEARYDVENLLVDELYPGMILNQDVYTLEGVRLARKSLEINTVMIQRIRSFSKTVGIKEPITVLIPSSSSQTTYL